MERCANAPTVTAVTGQPTPPTTTTTTHCLQWGLRSTGSGNIRHRLTCSLCDYALSWSAAVSSLGISSLLDQGLIILELNLYEAERQLVQRAGG